MNVHATTLNSPSAAVTQSLIPRKQDEHGDRIQTPAGNHKVAPQAVPTTTIDPRIILDDVVSAGSDTELTVQGLMEAWGKGNSEYDLNRDGGVNMKDLIELLGRLANRDQPQGDGPVPGAPSGVGENDVEQAGFGAETEQLSVDGLMAAWGQKGGDYDLDGDGTVGMNDLNKLLAMLAPENKPEAPTIDGPAGPGPVMDGTGSTEPTNLTVDGLMAAWGQRNSDYDLNGDGTVGMDDLVALLSRLDSPDATSSAAEAIASGATAPPENGQSVRGVLGDWGSRDSANDVDGDGVVNMNDLLSLLAQQSAQGGPVASPMIEHNGVQAPDIFASSGSQNDLSIQGLLEAWGERGNSEYDIDGNGRVGRRDLEQLLGKLGADESGLDVKRLARRIARSLHNHGFNSHPPANLHDIVQGFGLEDGPTKEVLASLRGAYPQGLGLNLKG